MKPNITTASVAAQQLRAKLTALKGSARADMYLADVLPVSASTAKVLIGYSPAFGAPTHEQVVSFVAASTARHMQVRDALSGSLLVQLGTLTDHPVSTVKAGVSVLVNASKITAPVDESKNMIAVGGTMFMDKEFGANWEIRTQADGSKVLECTRTENVPQLLETAVASQGLISGARVSFADPELQACASLQVEVGDFVEFWADGGVRRGDVTAVNGDKVTVQDDRPWNINPSAVTNILRKNTKAVNEDKKHKLAVFSAIWGKDFAGKFVNLEAQL